MELSDFPYQVPHLLPVGRWDSLREAHEHALVVLSSGVDCSIHPDGDGYALYTAAENAADASCELALYAEEQDHEIVIPEPEPENHPAGIAWFATWVLVLAMVFSRQVADPSVTERFSNSTAALFGQGEWWRAFTALFLHGDLAHLLGNLFIGGIFCLLAAKSLGAWKAWGLLLLGGTAGNLINAAVHQGQTFSSIGASTGTFAALGLLVGLALAAETRRGRYLRLKSLAIPLVAGALVFSMFGTNGENTDVGGHLWGSLSGVILGTAAGWLQRVAGQSATGHRLTLGCGSPPMQRMG